MRMQWLLLIALAVAGLASDYYIYRRLGELFKAKWVAKAHLYAAGLCWLALVAVFVLPSSMLLARMWLLFGFFSVYFSKVLYVLFRLIACVPCLWKGKPWRFVSGIGVAIAIITFLLLWWGALFNRFNTQVREITVEIPGLPSSLEGMRMVQISDLHLGTYAHDTAFVDSLFAEINSLHPDVVVFTGDLVNSMSDEAEPFVASMQNLKAPKGVYAILGNHDYGDYHEWPSAEAKRQNMDKLVDIFDRSGWKLLRNSTAWIPADGDSLAIIGVENIGDPPFPVYGDLRASYPGKLDDDKAKILLTHNPAHWINDIAGNATLNIGLTLSGHTHAMQAELFGVSPAVFRYPTWGGLYLDRSETHPLYVNIGAGTVGFPSRVGATPEITLITLKSAVVHAAD